jgi:hypothetical protein
MSVSHSRTGITHDHPDLLPHGWDITMHRAFGTSCLSLLKDASVKTLPGVIQKITAFGTKTIAFMMVTTIKSNHNLNSSGFPGYPGTFFRHLEHIQYNYFNPINDLTLYLVQHET